MLLRISVSAIATSLLDSFLNFARIDLRFSFGTCFIAFISTETVFVFNFGKCAAITSFNSLSFSKGLQEQRKRASN